MTRYSYHTTSEQINPLAQFDTAFSVDTPMGFSVSTNCAWWSLQIRGCIPVELGERVPGIFVDNCFYPFFQSPLYEDFELFVWTIDVTLDCGVRAHPEYNISRPVVVSYTIPGDPINEYINPLFLPLSSVEFGVIREMSVVMRRGYFQEMK